MFILAIISNELLKSIPWVVCRCEEMNYTRFLTAVSARREPSAIRALQPLLQIPGMISLGGGNPNPETFPISGCSFNLKNGQTVDLTASDVNEALQYSPTPGIPRLVEWLTKHQVDAHSPVRRAGQDWSIAVTTGSQDALAKTFNMLVAEGDTILVEEPAYSGALAALTPLKGNMIPIPSDAHGIIPEKLEAALAGLDPSDPPPKALYTIPTGGNPSGSTATGARKEKIYSIAQKHDFLILEDDPYYYLSFDDSPSNKKTYFGMDVDGRVLRYDSFSKVLSSGLRIGWVTGPKELVGQICLEMQATSLHSSGMSQMMAYKLLEHWGMDGFNSHLEFVKDLYRERRDQFCAAAENHLTGLAEWSPPTAGMFVWFKIDGVADTAPLVSAMAQSDKVLLVPGKAFTSQCGVPSQYVRASFSTASPEDMDKAMERFANALRKALDE